MSDQTNHFNGAFKVILMQTWRANLCLLLKLFSYMESSAHRGDNFAFLRNVLLVVQYVNVQWTNFSQRITINISTALMHL